MDRDVGLLYAHFSPLHHGLIQKKLNHSIQMRILNMVDCCIDLAAY